MECRVADCKLSLFVRALSVAPGSWILDVNFFDGPGYSIGTSFIESGYRSWESKTGIGLSFLGEQGYHVISLVHEPHGMEQRFIFGTSGSRPIFSFLFSLISRHQSLSPALSFTPRGPGHLRCRE